MADPADTNSLLELWSRGEAAAGDTLLRRFYDELLKNYHIIGTPGEGFGAAGEGFFRMTAFASRENTIKAMERIQKGSI